jgi:small subunit ribosomal protein S15
MKKMEEKGKPSWLKRDTAEIEALVVKFAKQGLSSEKIGLMIRDMYGIPKSNLFSGDITKILKKAGINQEVQDLSNLKKRAEQLEKHLAANKQDKVAKRSLHITKDKITNLSKYHNKGILN